MDINFRIDVRNGRIASITGDGISGNLVDISIWDKVNNVISLVEYLKIFFHERYTGIISSSNYKSFQNHCKYIKK